MHMTSNNKNMVNINQRKKLGHINKDCEVKKFYVGQRESIIYQTKKSSFLHFIRILVIVIDKVAMIVFCQHNNTSRLTEITYYLYFLGVRADE